MNNAEKYAKVFSDTFGIEENKQETLEYQGITAWDSVGHMGLISNLEETFDIMFDSEDIIDFSSYKKGKEILSGKYNISF